MTEEKLFKRTLADGDMGTWGGETDPDNDIELYASLFLKKKLELEFIPVNLFKLEEINLAITKLENGNIGRTFIEY